MVRAGGERGIPDLTTPSVEEMVEEKLMAEQLHRCLALLPEGERTLLEKIHFLGMTERQAAQALGVPNMTVHNRKVQILRKLKKMMAK